MLFLRQERASAALRAALVDMFLLLAEQSNEERADGLVVQCEVSRQDEDLYGAVTLLKGETPVMGISL